MEVAQANEARIFKTVLEQHQKLGYQLCCCQSILDDNLVVISDDLNKSVADKNLRLCSRDWELVPSIENICNKQFVNWEIGAKKVNKVDAVRNKADSNNVGNNKAVKSRIGENKARKSSLNVLIGSLKMVIEMNFVKRG